MKYEEIEPRTGVLSSQRRSGCAWRMKSKATRRSPGDSMCKRQPMTRVDE